MQCQQLLQFLQREENIMVLEEALYDTLATHILSCPLCSQGIDRLANAVDVFTCDTIHLRFPAYYEATHSSCLSGKLSSEEIEEVVVHLGQCASCAEEYQVLLDLWQREENI